MRRIVHAVSFGIGTFWAAALAAQTPPPLADLVGARAAGGETQMEARGYTFLRTTTVRDQKWSFWWNARTRQCVQIATMDGRYSAINTIPPGNCDAGPGRDDDYGRPPRPAAGSAPGYDDRYGRDDSLQLICYGEGDKPGIVSRSGYEWNDRRNRYVPRCYVENSRQDFDSQVQVDIVNGRGRIHLTGKLVAPINSGGRDGWWELQNLSVGPERITGRYRMNGLNSPRVDIDRRSGRIAIDGIEKFRGTCDVGRWGDGRTRF